MKVGALYRLSTLSLVSGQMGRKVTKDDELDIPGQKEAVHKFIAQKDGWQLVREYEEPGVSAYKKKAAERDPLQAALADAANQVIEALVVFKDDRLSRRSEEFPTILAEFASYGVSVWEVVEGRPIPYETHTDKLVAYIRGWKTEGESVGISQRSSERRMQKAARGEWPGGKVPLGYRLRVRLDDKGQPVMIGQKVKRDIEIDPETAWYVREIFGRYLNGEGFASIAAWMNTQPIRPKRAKEWQYQLIRVIIQNPIYKAQIQFGIRTVDRKDRKTQKLRPGAPKVVTDAPAELGIIPAEIWDRAQAVTASRRGQPPRTRQAKVPFIGVSRCGICGSVMTVNRSHIRLQGGKGPLKTYAYLSCNRYQKSKGCEGQGRGYRLEAVEEVLLQTFASITQPGGMLALAAELDSGREEKMERERKRLAQAKGRLQVVDQALKGLNRKRAEGEFTREEYEELKAEYLREKVELEAELEAPIPDQLSPDYRLILKAAMEIPRRWASMEPHEQKQLLADFCAAWGVDLVIHPGLEIEFAPRG